MIRSFWESLGRGARVGLVSGVIVIAAATTVGGYWLMRTDYQVLFADLGTQDAAAMVAELDKLKVPYVLADNGASILVDKAAVYKTRLKLMGGDLPLHGAVGFELFNNSDFGMTEFAQKINYQRALQGELTRTILALDEIRDARVLLALPEQGLFKQASGKAKASITLTMRSGATLTNDQVTGIQRLVSASVPGIDAQNVTIVDQTGIALTRPTGTDAEFDSGASRLDLKKDTETYLSRKVGLVLDRALGPGQGLASVDVSLNMDRIQATTEDVVPAAGRPGAAQAGVMVHERESQHDTGAPLDTKTVAAYNGAAQGGSSQREVDYAVGRRVEQVVSQPGSIRRIQVAVVVRRALDSNQQDQIRRMVAASVGASADRGDTVVVQTLDALNAPAAAYGVTPPMVAPAASEAASTAVAVVPEPASAGLNRTPGSTRLTPWFIGFALCVLAALASFLVRRRPSVGDARAARPGSDASAASRALTDDERRAALAQVEAWLRGEHVASSTRELS
ncbi:flagellar basal-body MS-ring/collar protein FliF [Trinickia fusca]|uniref:Flagellar M-ring protein n=1 Tax=Trinickia fusca TaxID=2419777 RepID=A0A494XIH3_9BURK|nr:flagellar basal-body MS-ring/collar protein FliF [Trinickia fusca]RKP48416.1 flagellar M-ring protein FliF [Trinickia fusca]